MNLEENLKQWEDERRLDRDRFWMKLRTARHDYLKESFSEGKTSSDVDEAGFYYYMQRKYGVKIHLNEAGQILPDFSVVDENAFLMFMLKYS